MLKKVFSFTIACLGLVIILSGCGIGDDTVTDTKYNVDLKKAAEIYLEEAGDNPLLKVSFDTVLDDSYHYIFTNESEKINIDPKSGDVTKESKVNSLSENEMTFSASEVMELGKVNTILEKAKKEVGGLSPRILTWELSNKGNNLVYTVDVKTTTSDKVVTIDAEN